MGKKISAADYVKLPEGPPQQLIQGEIIMSPSPSSTHQYICIELATILKNHVTTNGIGYIFTAPLDVYFTEEDVYQPDIIFISNEQKKIIKQKIEGVPDLVIEVLFPSNAYYDLTHKKNIYEETGVKEFWLVDPDEKTVEIYENTNGTFMLFSKAKKSGTVSSKLLNGLNIEIEKLFVEI